MFGLDLLAYGPVGGINPDVAVKWVIIWTVLLGGMLYGSLMFSREWVELDTESH